MQRKVVQAITASDRMVSFMPVDIIYWSNASELLFDTMSKKARVSGFKGWELVTTGAISPQAKQALEERRFVVKEQFAY